MPAFLRELDVVVLLWMGQPRCGSTEEFERAARCSPRQLSNSLARLERVGLYSREVGRVLSGPAVEFLIHGVRFCFPGAVDRTKVRSGLATAWSVDPLAEHIVGTADPLVWERRGGPSRGAPVAPLHPSVPALALASREFYVRAALVEAIRLGRVRDRAEASRLLTQDMAA